MCTWRSSGARAAKQDKRLLDVVDSNAASAKKHAMLEEIVAQNHTDHEKSIDALKKVPLSIPFHSIRALHSKRHIVPAIMAP